MIFGKYNAVNVKFGWKVVTLVSASSMVRVVYNCASVPSGGPS